MTNPLIGVLAGVFDSCYGDILSITRMVSRSDRLTPEVCALSDTEANNTAEWSLVMLLSDSQTGGKAISRQHKYFRHPFN